MLRDRYGREVDGLRLCVTARCNLDCIYCHNEGQLRSPLCIADSRSAELSLDQIRLLAQACFQLGIKHLKLTGGEPLLRSDLAQIASCCSEYFQEISLVTNATMLDRELAQQLAESGISRININLPGLDPEIYSRITRRDWLENALAGVQIARESFDQLKLNFVYTSLNGNQLPKLMDFCAQIGSDLQVIELNPMGNRELEQYHLPLDNLKQQFSKMALQTKIRSLHSRARYLIPWAGSLIWVELVPGYCNPEFCSGCRRIRITANGRLRPCLMSDLELDLVPALSLGSTQGICEVISRGVELRVVHSKSWRNS